MYMKSLITTLLAFGLIWPAATYAFTIEELIEAAKAGNGTYVESHSSVSTGGQTARSGETVVTGDSSASSHVETRINSNNEGGTIDIKIETSKNGEVKTTEYSKQIEKDKSVRIDANAEVTDTDSKVQIEIDGEAVESETTEKTAETPAENNVASVIIASESKFSLLFTEKIPSAFKKVLSFFWRF